MSSFIYPNLGALAQTFCNDPSVENRRKLIEVSQGIWDWTSIPERAFSGGKPEERVPSFYCRSTVHLRTPPLDEISIGGPFFTTEATQFLELVGAVDQKFANKIVVPSMAEAISQLGDLSSILCSVDFLFKHIRPKLKDRMSYDRPSNNSYVIDGNLQITLSRLVRLPDACWAWGPGTGFSDRTLERVSCQDGCLHWEATMEVGVLDPSQIVKIEIQ